ncbi:MAG: hypothetical protein GEU80_12970 [Dehalococcoidia bacterium]|nr:hypothetical protein [Dehalococcoidia bacterium]
MRPSWPFSRGGGTTARPTKNGTSAAPDGSAARPPSKLAAWLADQRVPDEGAAPSTSSASLDPSAPPPETGDAGPPGAVASPPVRPAVAEPPPADAEVAPVVSAIAVRPPTGAGFHIDTRIAVKFAAYALLIVVQAAAVGYVLSDQRDDVFGARTEILFPLEADRATGFLREDRRLATQLEAIRSRAVLGPVAERHGLSPEVLRGATEVSVVGASEVIRLEAHHRDPELAQALAADIAAEYLSQVEEDGVAVAEAVLADELGALEDRRAEVGRQLATIDEARRSLPPTDEPSVLLTSLSAEEARLLAESSSLFSRIGEIRGQVTALDVEQALTPRPSVISDTYLLDKRVSPRPLRDAALAAALGATVAAAVLAVLLVRRSAVPRGGD